MKLDIRLVSRIRDYSSSCLTNCGFEYGTCVGEERNEKRVGCNLCHLAKVKVKMSSSKNQEVFNVNYLNGLVN